MKINLVKYKELLVGLMAGIFATYSTLITLSYTKEQDKFQNNIKLIETKMTESNLMVAKANSFSALMNQFIKGTDEEKEYALVLMVQVDSILAYKILATLARIQDKNLQPTIKNVLVNEANKIQENQSLISDPQKLIKAQKNNKPKEILADLNSRTTFSDIKSETGQVLSGMSYIENLNLAKAFYKIQHFKEALRLLQLVNEKLPGNKKVTKIDSERIKYNIERKDTVAALKIFIDAFEK
jgi:hypothetical protein